MESKEKRPVETGRSQLDQLVSMEQFYENLRKVPIKYLDFFIGLCAAALVIVVALGIWNR